MVTHAQLTAAVLASELLPDKRADRHNSYPRSLKGTCPVEEAIRVMSQPRAHPPDAGVTLRPEIQRHIETAIQAMKNLARELDEDDTAEAADFVVEVDELRRELLRKAAVFNNRRRERES